MWHRISEVDSCVQRIVGDPICCLTTSLDEVDVLHSMVDQVVVTPLLLQPV